MAREGLWELMEREVYKAGVNGDVTLFSNPIKKDKLLQKTHNNNNILHIAVQHERVHFTKATLNNFPKNTCESLICQQNNDGNTPLHIAAEIGDQAVVELLCEYCSEGGGSVLPWRMMNSEGNTPAHVALLYGNVTVARYLVGKDVELARLVNHSKETLLHLAIQYFHGTHVAQQDLLPTVILLLETDSTVACWADVEGSTPLHRAASLKPPSCLCIIEAILTRCPQAAEVREQRSSQTVLHLLTNHQVPSYEEGVALLRFQEVYALRNCKNSLGDTPLHSAVLNDDKNMVRVLLGSSPNLNIKNKKGVTAGSLVQQLCILPLDQVKNTEILVERRRKLTEDECGAAKRADFEYLNDQLVFVGLQFLDSQAPKGGNILHILMSCKFSDDAKEFIGEAIRKVPLLITQKDGHGDTPIHILAKNDKMSERLLTLCKINFEMAQASDVLRDMLSGSTPWRIRNVEGDTPLHIAARAKCDVTIRKLLEFDEEVAGLVNNRKETPLHLRCYWLSTQDVKRNQENESEKVAKETMRNMMTKGSGYQAYMQDVDGLTPLHIAISNHSDLMIQTLVAHAPESLKVADLKGRTPWHLLAYQPLNKCLITLVDKLPGMCEDHLVTSKDNDGNTPLHVALANESFEFAMFYLDNAKIDKESSKEDKLQQHLKSDNNDGISCYELIGSAEHLSRDFEKCLSDLDISLIGHRSMYGVPTTKINDYANTIGVIAALLATITFTAAFAVPGGLDSTNGTPLLLRRTAFQVFLVSDVVALCSSVMVLFCLLWIMTTGHKRDSILLLDVSVFLLETSFYTTLLTFMTGLYVTVVPIVPEIAIFTCVTCSCLILIMRKCFVMVTIVPLCNFLILCSLSLKELFSEMTHFRY